MELPKNTSAMLESPAFRTMRITFWLAVPAIAPPGPTRIVAVPWIVPIEAVTVSCPVLAGRRNRNPWL